MDKGQKQRSHRLSPGTLQGLRAATIRPAPAADVLKLNVPAACQKVVEAYSELNALFEASLPKSTSPARSDGLDEATGEPLCEKAIRAYLRLQEETRARLAAAVHELKTPLAIIAGYTELLLSQKLGPLNERQQGILQDSQAGCTRLQQFIQEFLAYSALVTGQVTLKMARGDLAACLSEVFGFWSPLFQQKSIALYFPGSTDLRQFSFDYHKVQQTVSKLLENALKFTPQGGTVWLTAEPHFWDRRDRQVDIPRDLRKRAHRHSNTVRVTVADTGPGIPHEYQREVFNEFYKLNQPGIQAEGVGLGLAIARRLVEAHGGTIWTESEPGVGSKFSFLLPLKSQPHD